MLHRRTILILVIAITLAAGCTVYRRDGSEIGKTKSDQVYICHKGKTMRVDDAAVRAHLNHGDRLGHC